MPEPSKRELLLDATKALLDATGYQVYLGEAPAFGEDDPDEVIVVMVEPDEVDHKGEGFLVTVPLSIQAVVKAGVSALDFSRAYRSAETVIAAIKRAMEVEDRTLGGLVAWNGLERGSTAPLEREPGSEFVGVSVQYRAPIEEGWGAP
jgi:hypothetical protein